MYVHTYMQQSTHADKVNLNNFIYLFIYILFYILFNFLIKKGVHHILSYNCYGDVPHPQTVRRELTTAPFRSLGSDVHFKLSGLRGHWPYCFGQGKLQEMTLSNLIPFVV